MCYAHPLPARRLHVTLALTACATTGSSTPAANATVAPTATAPAAPEYVVYSGELTYLTRNALPDDALAIIELRQGRTADAPLVAEQRIPLRGAQVPIPFSLAVPPARLAGKNDLQLRAIVHTQGQHWLSPALDVPASSQKLGSLTLTHAPDKPFASTLLCGTEKIVVSPGESGLTLRAGGESFTLQPVPAASGSKFVLPGDDSTYYWSKGSTARVQIKGKALPECGDAREREPTLTARGNEPGWRVQVFNQPCRDSMTGMPYPHRVELFMNKKTHYGCGGNPADLITGVAWQITHIDGQAVLADNPPTLQLDAEGRVSGNSSCNRYMGGYTLTGEGLSFGKLAGTMMACPDERMAQERKLLTALGAVQNFSLREDGALVLNGRQHQIIARRP